MHAPQAGDIWMKIVAHGREIRFIKEFGLDRNGEFVSWYIPGRATEYVCPYFTWQRWAIGTFRLAEARDGWEAFKVIHNGAEMSVSDSWNIA
jgi:hypothetical protein